MIKKCLLSLFVISNLFSVKAFAEPAQGTDSWTIEMNRQGLFSVHRNTCTSSTEAFVPVVTGGEWGFCIEKSERTALNWLAARQACIDIGKRLPESSEFQHACNINTSASLGLTNMTNNWEWASNFTVSENWSYYGVAGMNAPLMGNGACNKSTPGLSAGTGAVEAWTFRCVR